MQNPWAGKGLVQMPLTMEDLERRISRLEEDRQEFTAIIQAINTLNQTMAREFQFFRDAIVEHREEVRGEFAELVTRLRRLLRWVGSEG